MQSEIVAKSQTLSKYNNGDKALIILNIEDGDMSKGDTKGKIGIGEKIAAKLGGEAICLSHRGLRDLYKQESVPIEELYRRFFKENGSPDIVIGSSESIPAEVLACSSQQNKFTLEVSKVNESLSFHYLKHSELVAHHLTPELLESKGAEFRRIYPEMPKPLIAVMIAQPMFFEYRSFAKLLASITSQYDQAQIFLCPNRRVSSGTLRRIQTLIEKYNSSENIKITSWDFHGKEKYNPYLGLLANADHFIVWGESTSMVAEPLFTGKTVHVYKPVHNFEYLSREGYVKKLNNKDRGKPLSTLNMEPVDVTSKLAEAITQDFLQKRSKVCGGIFNLAAERLPTSKPE